MLSLIIPLCASWLICRWEHKNPSVRRESKKILLHIKDRVNRQSKAALETGWQDWYLERVQVFKYLSWFKQDINRLLPRSDSSNHIKSPAMLVLTCSPEYQRIVCCYWTSDTPMRWQLLLVIDANGSNTLMLLRRISQQILPQNGL